MTLDVSPVSWGGGFIRCPCGALQPERVLRGVLEVAVPARARVGEPRAALGSGPHRHHRPLPRAPEGGDTALEIRGRSGLHAVSEKCNTIN